MRLLLLTLEKHKDGIWVTRLVNELERINTHGKFDFDVTVQIVAIERILHQVVLVDSNSDTPNNNNNDNDHYHTTLPDDVLDVPFLQQYDGIINRVSDAADPVLMKRCIAILTVAKNILYLPVFNGPTAYSLCSNKWCHHILFTMAKLLSPSTAIIDIPSLTTNSTGTSETILNISRRLLPNDPLPHLIKPNAGGFGNGIIKIGDIAATGGTVTPVPTANDDTVLLQAYCNSNTPGIQTIYRVWFLLGKVQCAVQRTVTSPNTFDAHDHNPYHANDEFTSGCSANYNKSSSSTTGGTCEYPHRTKSNSVASTTTTTTVIQPWTVPDDVRIEIEDQLLPLLHEDGHTGSVEFLLHYNETTNIHQRYYFDLNLLSTLPIMDNHDQSGIIDHDTVWDIDYNPWAELAHGIVSVMMKGKM